MRFFEHQRLAKKKTQYLYRTFIILVLLISSLTGLVVSSLFIDMSTMDSFHFSSPLFNSIFVIGIITFCIISLVSWLRVRKLMRNPSQICRELGAKSCHKDKHGKYQQYLNIVEEMSIASGVPMPKTYLLDEDSINAFACGFDINSSAICMTTGALEQLSRDELQAVIGHEFSHILNGDMKLNLKLIGLIHGLVFIFEIGDTLIRRGRSSRKSQGAPIGLGLMALGGVGWIGGSWLKSKISIQREFLADASSVQFTRDSQALIRAFEKIELNGSTQLIKRAGASELSHMFFSQSFNRFFGFKTHPPIRERIKRIEGKYKNSTYKIPSKKMNSSVKNDSTKKDFILGRIALSLSSNPTDDIELILYNMLRKEGEYKEASDKKILNHLQVLYGLIGQFESTQKRQYEKFLMEEVKKDSKINFHEFIIVAYLRPAFKEIPVKFRSLKAKDLKTEIALFTAFVLKVSLLNDIPGDLNLACLQKSHEVSQVSYLKLFPMLEKLRFSHIDLKEEIISDLSLIFNYDKTITQKESLLLQLLHQILAIPIHEK
jgi:Zn-dependent protease with chaperone function